MSTCWLHRMHWCEPCIGQWSDIDSKSFIGYQWQRTDTFGWIFSNKSYTFWLTMLEKPERAKTKVILYFTLILRIREFWIVNVNLGLKCRKSQMHLIHGLFHVVMSYVVPLSLSPLLHVSICLRVAVCCQYVCTCQRAPSDCTPTISSSRQPYTASLSPSNSPSARGWLLPFRQGPWFLLVGVRWLSCVMCIWEASSSSSSSPSFASLLHWCCWAVTCRRGPAVEKHRFRSLFTLPPTAMALWNRKTWKSWNHSDWSLDVL